MIQYLLGVLPQQWQERFEEKLFTQHECLERLRVVENKLVDDYVNEILSDADRQRFEKYYLTSERRRRKVELAHALKKSLADLATPAEPQPQNTRIPQTSWQRWQERFALFTAQTQTRFRITLLMGALVLLGGGFFLLAILLRTQLPQQEEARVRVEPPHTTPTASVTPSASLPAPVSTGSVQPAPVFPLPRRENSVTIELAPDSLRDGGSAQKTVNIGQESLRFIRLKLLLRHPPAYSTWRVIVTSSESVEVYRATGASEKANRQIPYIYAQLPIRKLAKGDYIVSLQGKNVSGEFAAIEDYTLHLIDR